MNKANRIFGLIRRSYQYLDRESMKMLFTALVCPHLEFGNVVGAPHFQKDWLLIEGVQRCATKLVPGLTELDYSERLKSIYLPSMKYRRERGNMTETYMYANIPILLVPKGVQEKRTEVLENKVDRMWVSNAFFEWTHVKSSTSEGRRQCCSSFLRNMTFSVICDKMLNIIHYNKPTSLFC